VRPTPALPRFWRIAFIRASSSEEYFADCPTIDGNNPSSRKKNDLTPEPVESGNGRRSHT
jgi:hypothetical protein